MCLMTPSYQVGRHSSGSVALRCRVARHYSSASQLVSRPAPHRCDSVAACLHVLLAFNVPLATRLVGP
jgi:hypothetical protein